MRLSWLLIVPAEVAAAVLGLSASLVAELCDELVVCADQIDRLEAQVR